MSDQCEHDWEVTPQTHNFLELAKCKKCPAVMGATIAEAILNEHAPLKRKNKKLQNILHNARWFIESVREPSEPTNLAKSPAAAWLHAEELRKSIESYDAYLSSEGLNE